MLRIKMKEQELKTLQKRNLLNELTKDRMLLKKKPKRKKKRRVKKKPGPKGYGLLKRSVRFDETAIGHFMYIYTPIQYHLLMQYASASNVKEPGRAIKHNVIEAIALNSDNKAFRTVRFRKALILYRRSGMHPLRKTQWSLNDAAYFARHSFRIHEAIKNASSI